MLTKQKQKEYLKDLIRGCEREITVMMVKVWYFQNEVNNPIKMNKEKAQENLDVYSKRIEYLKADLELYQAFKVQL